MERESCSKLYDVEQDSRFGRHVGDEAKGFHPKRPCSRPTRIQCLTARNPAAAHRVIARIKRSIDMLADFPRSAKTSEIPNVREMPIVRYPYVVFYTIDDVAQEVIILRVRHTSQDTERHI